MKREKVGKYKTNKLMVGLFAGCAIGSLVGMILDRTIYMLIGMFVGLLIAGVYCAIEKLRKIKKEQKEQI